MSSPTISSPTTTDFQPTPTNSDGITNDGGGMQRGANYFFGFLITFVVLLLIFIGCGIGSRRRFVARRRAMLLASMDPWAPLEPNGEYRRPLLHEKGVVAGDDSDDWASIMPLSLRLLRHVDDADHDLVNDSIAPQSIATRTNPRRGLSRLLPSFLTSTSSRPETSPVQDEEKQAAVQLPHALQVSVVILMPTSLHHSRHPSSLKQQQEVIIENELPPYQIGVVEVPWHNGFPSS